MEQIRKVSVIGLGKLGLPILASLAKRGFGVVGVDNNARVLEAVRQRKAHFYEPDLDDCLHSAENITLTENIAEAVQQTDATIIIVPTPSRKDGSFSYDFVVQAAEQIGKGLKQKKGYHLVINSSTVSPGSMKGPILEALEKHSGKKAGKDFGLCYNPEFVALGAAIKGLIYPDFVLIGEIDKRSGDTLQEFYSRFCQNNPPVAHVNLIEAEIAKIAINTYITAKISFANFLAQICQRSPGSNVDNVSRVLGLDSRIGPKYLKGAVSYGGPCFPRDNNAIAQYARSLSVDARLPEAVDAFNRHHVLKVAEFVREKIQPKNTVGILGLSYKPHTSVVDESFGLALARHFSEQNIPVMVYDPKGMENAKNVLNSSATYSPSAEECIKGSDIVILATDWPEFSKLDQNFFTHGNKQRIILDCWRMLDGNAIQKVAKYYALGKAE